MRNFEDIIEDLELIKNDAGRRIADPRIRNRYIGVIRSAIIAMRKSENDMRMPCEKEMPKEHPEKCNHSGRKYMCSDMVQVTVVGKDGKPFVWDDCTINGRWVNAEDLEVTAWRPMLKPYIPAKREIPKEWCSYIELRFMGVE